MQAQEEGCWCWKGSAVRAASEGMKASEAEHAERMAKLAAARGESETGRYPPWRLVCKYRGCLKEFERERAWTGKPHYCCKEHQGLEVRARLKDRQARRKQMGEAAPDAGAVSPGPGE